MVNANAKCDETTARNYKNEREPRGRVHFSGINPVFCARDGEQRFKFHEVDDMGYKYIDYSGRRLIFRRFFLQSRTQEPILLFAVRCH